MPRYTVPVYERGTMVALPEETPEDRLTAAASRGVSLFSFDCIGLLLWWCPVGKRLEAIIAECIGESLAAGLSEIESFHLASKVFCNRRVGICLGKTASAIRSGQSVFTALKATSPRLSAAFFEAIRVGEERDQLSAELRAIAQRLLPGCVCQRLARWTGRSTHAIQFAGALARLLNDHRLTASAVDDAGKIAATGDKRFLAVMDSVTERMKDGGSLAQSLRQFPQDFDPMFMEFVDVPSSRTALRINLTMLACEHNSGNSSFI